MLKVLPVIALLTVGCSFAPSNLQSKHSTDLEARKIRRIAVLPPIVAPSVPAVKTPLGAAPDPQAAERNAAEHLAKSIYSAMSSLPNWQIVSDSEIREVEQPLGPAISHVAFLDRGTFWMAGTRPHTRQPRETSPKTLDVSRRVVVLEADFKRR